MGNVRVVTTKLTYRIYGEKEDNMKRYFVKALISGWHEVDEEHYKSFIEYLRKGITAIPGKKKKEEYIKTRIKIIEE